MHMSIKPSDILGWQEALKASERWFLAYVKYVQIILYFNHEYIENSKGCRKAHQVLGFLRRSKPHTKIIECFPCNAFKTDGMKKAGLFSRGWKCGPFYAVWLFLSLSSWKLMADSLMTSSLACHFFASVRSFTLLPAALFCHSHSLRCVNEQPISWRTHGMFTSFCSLLGQDCLDHCCPPVAYRLDMAHLGLKCSPRLLPGHQLLLLLQQLSWCLESKPGQHGCGRQQGRPGQGEITLVVVAAKGLMQWREEGGSLHCSCISVGGRGELFVRWVAVWRPCVAARDVGSNHLHSGGGQSLHGACATPMACSPHGVQLWAHDLCSPCLLWNWTALI